MIKTELYKVQLENWPTTGNAILAQYDETSLIVYQAYNLSIGRFAIAHQKLGGDFSYSRMSWIKPNFLWMMYRSNWGTSENQEMVLALRIKREFFDRIVRQAVPSTWDSAHYTDRSAWQNAVAQSEVRLQWDPDHDPHGKRLARRAIQLGLRGQTLIDFGMKEIIEIIDMTPLVAEQREIVRSGDLSRLQTPLERMYPDPTTTTQASLDKNFPDTAAINSMNAVN